MRFGGVIVVFHLDADGCRAKTHVPQARREVLHRVPYSRLHVTVGIAKDVVFGHPTGSQTAYRVHIAPPPDRLPLHPEQHTLMNVEGPSVITRKPGLVRRVGHEHGIKTGLAHRGSCQRDAAIVFCLTEGGISLGHGWTSTEFHVRCTQLDRRFVEWRTESASDFLT